MTQLFWMIDESDSVFHRMEEETLAKTFFARTRVAGYKIPFFEFLGFQIYRKIELSRKTRFPGTTQFWKNEQHSTCVRRDNSFLAKHVFLALVNFGKMNSTLWPYAEKTQFVFCWLLLERDAPKRFSLLCQCTRKSTLPLVYNNHNYSARFGAISDSLGIHATRLTPVF